MFLGTFLIQPVSMLLNLNNGIVFWIESPHFLVLYVFELTFGWPILNPFLPKFQLWIELLWVSIMANNNQVNNIRDGLARKNCCSFGFCFNEGGAAPAFLVNKGVYFLQNANNFNSKLYLGCIYILLNLQIPKSKLGGGGGGGNLDKIQKNSSFSLWDRPLVTQWIS